MLRIVADRGRRALVVGFGAEAAHDRTKLYPACHARRHPVPKALAWQFEQTPALLEAFGWSAPDHPELEADDLLGSLGPAEEAGGGRCLILTGDRNTYQCGSVAFQWAPAPMWCPNREGSGRFDVDR